MKGRVILVAVACVTLAACSSTTTPDRAAPAVTAVSTEVAPPATVGALTITGAYIPQPASPTVAAAYLSIASSGPADELVGAQADVSPQVMLHRTQSDGKVGGMVEVSELAVPAGGTAVLQTGGNHLMIMDPTTRLREGDTVTLTLTFATAGQVQLTVPVVAAVGPQDMDMPMGSAGG